MVALLSTSKQGFASACTSSLVYALASNNFPTCGFHFLTDYHVVMGRNGAAQTAIEMGYEYLLFIDSDMDFPVNTLARLKACGSDIACADMWSRNIPSFRTVMRYTKEKSKDGKKQFASYDGKGVEDVDCTGMACTLIRVSLLRKFAKKKTAPFAMNGVHGEDAYFCLVAKQKFGASIRCDFDVVAGHWGSTRQAGQDYTRDVRNTFGEVPDPAYLKRMGVLGFEEAGNEKGAVE